MKKMCLSLCLGIAFSMLLSSCAGLMDLRPLGNTPAPPKRIAVPDNPPPQRELGSLWSKQSVWNEIYSNPPNLIPGDVIELRLSEKFRKQVLRRLKRDYPVRVVTKVDIKEDGKTLDPSVKAEAASDDLGPDDTTTMHATIVEVLPRGVYKLAASETIHVGDRDPVVTLEGEIRDRDIKNSASADTDDILNLAMELQPYGRQRRLPDNT